MTTAKDLTVALVTGAGTGIGRETALLLAAMGMEVMAVGRTERTLSALSEESGADYLVESVATEAGCERIVSEARRRLGRIDVLVNNAGTDSDGEQPIWKQRTEVWDEVLATNLNGPFFLTRAVAAEMIERRWGRIVMVASTAGELGGARMSAYCASKHALVGLMRAVAQDVAPYGVTCNAVCPGWVRTEMSEHTAAREAEERGVSPEDVWRERAASSPAGRVIEPGEVAEVISFLAGAGSSAVNGETVTISLGSPW
jgi:NAD(P)-dependent dehydrogenase (short-subunit alcohol dehydrogenase family)